VNAEPQTDKPYRHLRVVTETTGEHDADERRPTPGEVAGGERHVRIPVNIFDCPYLSHGAVRLYGRLQQHTGEAGCFPSYETLAERMGCSQRAVKGYRQELEDAGVIVHKRGGGARSNRYELTPERLRDKSAKSAQIGAKSAKSALESVQKTTGKSAKSAQESYLSNQTSLTRDSAPTERAAPPSKPAAKPAVRTPKQPAPTVNATPPEREHVPRAKLASAEDTPPSALREPTPIQRVEQGIKAAGVKVAVSWGPDGKALATLLAGSDVTTEDVIGCYVAIARGEYGDQYAREHLSVLYVCTRCINGYLNWRQNPALPVRARSNGNAPTGGLSLADLVSIGKGERQL
jgi:biotin operon repressor